MIGPRRRRLTLPASASAASRLSRGVPLPQLASFLASFASSISLRDLPKWTRVCSHVFLYSAAPSCTSPPPPFPLPSLLPHQKVATPSVTFIPHVVSSLAFCLPLQYCGDCALSPCGTSLSTSTSLPPSFLSTALGRNHSSSSTLQISVFALVWLKYS